VAKRYLYWESRLERGGVYLKTGKIDSKGGRTWVFRSERVKVDGSGRFCGKNADNSKDMQFSLCYNIAMGMSRIDTFVL